MTFEQWLETKKTRVKYHSVIFYYAGDLTIEFHSDDKMPFFLCIASMEYTSNTIEPLERILFDWACGEGYFN